MKHFINLSNGLVCVHPDMEIPEEPDLRFVRIQSTHCEQKHWNLILQGLGPDFLMAAATGLVIVHDQSERDRETRAMWQGLEWVKYVLWRNWKGTELLLENNRKQPPLWIGRLSYGRNGIMLSRYFEQQYRALPKATLNNIRYYRRYVKVQEPMIFSCHRV